MKKVLIISSSPRRRGNSDTLCDEFKKGAEESGNAVEKLFLADKKIGYCKGCETCNSLGKPCPQKDDAAEIIEKMILSDVIVLATPAYFYTMSAQLKNSHRQVLRGLRKNFGQAVLFYNNRRRHRREKR